MDIKNFIKKKTNKNKFYNLLYQTGKFSDYDFLYLFSNNELKMNNLPLKRGNRIKKTKKKRMRMYLSKSMFEIVENLIDQEIEKNSHLFFGNFVDFKDIVEDKPWRRKINVINK